jgi:hypothetical protein
MGGGTANSFLSTFAAHLPERLGAAILVNPPGLFDILLAVVRPFIDARTMGKVKIIRPTQGRLAEELAPFGVTSPGQLQWLERVLAMEATPGNLPSRRELGDIAHLLTHTAAEQLAKELAGSAE